MNKFFFASILAAIFIGSSGCLKMGPDYQQPDVGFKIPDQYHQKAQPFLISEDKTDRWWETFNNPNINELVIQVAQNNLDIKKSTASVLEFQARLTQTRSRRWPGLSGNANAKKSQSTITAFDFSTFPFEAGSERSTSNTFTLSLPATFELDLWGKLARADEAARYDLLQMEETRKTLIQSIIAETVSLYLELESLERRIAVNELKIDTFEKTLDLIEKRYVAGLSNSLEIRQTRRALTQAKSVLPTLYQALGTVQHRLAVLVGNYPKTSPIRVHVERYYKKLSPVPTGLPSQLLQRRPDIRTAEASLAAACARIGEAKANRFPSITLTGIYGNTSSELDELLTSGGEFWNIAAGITAPLFDAGARKAAHKAALARYEQQLVSYAKTVLSAFSEVETALMTREQQLKRRAQLVEYLEEARAVQKTAINRYEKGLADYLNVLDAVISRFRAEEDIILSDLTLMQNRVTLHRALGGGWPSMDETLAQGKDADEKSKRDRKN